MFEERKKINPTLIKILLASTLVMSSQLTMANKINKKPNFIRGQIIETYFDGITDDLATAGMGLAGLQASAGPVPDDRFNRKRLTNHTLAPLKKPSVFS
ncbi:MAG: hydroxybutyrate-dimer hydrolase [Candidatus Endobugula sp.]|jgi:hydroxybutyrate-dimer hydrolase